MGLIDFLDYIRSRKFVKQYESNPNNYEPPPDGRNVSCLKASSRYINAALNVSMWKDSRIMNQLERLLKKIKKTA